MCLEHCMWVVCHSIAFRSTFHVFNSYWPSAVQIYMILQKNYKRWRVILSLCMPLSNIQGVGITQVLLNLSTRQRWVVTITSSCYTTHWIGGQGCPRASLQRDKSLGSVRNRTPDRPVYHLVTIPSMLPWLHKRRKLLYNIKFWSTLFTQNILNMGNTW